MTSPSPKSEVCTAGHTPGPWFKRGRCVSGSIEREKHGEKFKPTIARICDDQTSGYDCPSLAEAEANLALIAAAPDMLTALLAYREHGFTQAVEQMAEAAVAKATLSTGGQP